MFIIFDCRLLFVQPGAFFATVDLSAKLSDTSDSLGLEKSLIYASLVFFSEIVIHSSQFRQSFSNNSITSCLLNLHLLVGLSLGHNSSHNADAILLALAGVYRQKCGP